MKRDDYWDLFDFAAVISANVTDVKTREHLQKRLQEEFHPVRGSKFTKEVE